eukprot:TRINITY_DN15937_c0_g2_i2.p1 TRINITY_DN15937_c0_g2~~TRINITY_DN15937_c0_g2_i2.p1  ORF type:complete len:502 (+),score=94.33 TRINITY_DN15937_c0_g2_i2:87-1592(+)
MLMSLRLCFSPLLDGRPKATRHLAHSTSSFFSHEQAASTRRRTLFHKLRDPPALSLTINQRRDWPLVDLQSSPEARRGSALVMNSLELVRHAELLERRCCRWRPPESSSSSSSSGAVVSLDKGNAILSRSSTSLQVKDRLPGEWDAVALRFMELAAEMDADLVSRLLRSLARANFGDSALLGSLVRALPIENQDLMPAMLARLASAVLVLREKIGPEEFLAVASRLEKRVTEHSSAAWGLSSTQMLAFLAALPSLGDCSASVPFGANWRPAHSVLLSAIASEAGRMGAVQLGIAAYACSRVSRNASLPAHSSQSYQSSEQQQPTELSDAAMALLRYCIARVDRFLPRGLLNTFIALERLVGAAEVLPLAVLVAERLQHCDAGALAGFSIGDRYRSSLCLLRASNFASQAKDPSGNEAARLDLALPAALSTLLQEPSLWKSLAEPAKAALLARLEAAAGRSSGQEEEWRALRRCTTRASNDSSAFDTRCHDNNGQLRRQQQQ